MKVVWYLLCILLGAWGALLVLAFLETVVFGTVVGSSVVQLLLGLVLLALAWKALQKGRSA